jgi:hypothetical protein
MRASDSQQGDMKEGSAKEDPQEADAINEGDMRVESIGTSDTEADSGLLRLKLAASYSELRSFETKTSHGKGRSNKNEPCEAYGCFRCGCNSMGYSSGQVFSCRVSLAPSPSLTRGVPVVCFLA